MPGHTLTVDGRAEEKQMRACAREWQPTHNGPVWSIGDGLTVSIRRHGAKMQATVRDRYTGLSARVIASQGESAYVQLGVAINMMADAEAGITSRQ